MWPSSKTSNHDIVKKWLKESIDNTHYSYLENARNAQENGSGDTVTKRFSDYKKRISMQGVTDGNAHGFADYLKRSEPYNSGDLNGGQASDKTNLYAALAEIQAGFPTNENGKRTFTEDDFKILKKADQIKGISTLALGKYDQLYKSLVDKSSVLEGINFNDFMAIVNEVKRELKPDPSLVWSAPTARQESHRITPNTAGLQASSITGTTRVNDDALMTAMEFALNAVREGEGAAAAQALEDAIAIYQKQLQPSYIKR